MKKHPAPSKNPLIDAREGNLQALYNLSFSQPREAYKWLLVAYDFGHKKAAQDMADLEECNSEFKYDDDGITMMGIHFELAESYLRGLNGLPINLKRARKYLEQFLDGPHSTLADLDPLLKHLNADAKMMVEKCVLDHPFRALKRRVDRIQHLAKLNREGAQVPVIILENEIERMREELAAVVEAAITSRS